MPSPVRFVLALNINIYAHGEGFLRVFTITLSQSTLVRGLVGLGVCLHLDHGEKPRNLTPVINRQTVLPAFRPWLTWLETLLPQEPLH